MTTRPTTRRAGGTLPALLCLAILAVPARADVALTVTTQPAAEVTNSSARLVGTLDPTERR